LSKTHFIPGRRTLYLADLYYHLYDAVDFKFKLYDENNEEIQRSLHHNLLKESVKLNDFDFQTGNSGGDYDFINGGNYVDRSHSSKYYFENTTVSTYRMNESEYYVESKISKIVFKLIDDRTGDIPAGVKSIRLYLNENFLNSDIPFFSYEFNGSNEIDTFKIMNEKRFIPVVFYDDNGDAINDVKLEYRRLFDYGGNDNSNDFTYQWQSYYSKYSGAMRNVLSVDILDKRHVIEKCSSIGFILGIDAELSYSDVKYTDDKKKTKTEDPAKIKEFEKFIFIGDEEIECERIVSDDESQKIKMIGCVFFKGDAPTCTTKKAKTVDLHIIPITANTYEKEIDIQSVQSKTVFSTVKNVQNSNGNIVIPFKKLFDDSMNEKMQLLKQNLIGVTDESGETVSFLNYSWKDATLRITLDSMKPSFQRLTFEFQQYYCVFPKDGIDDAEERKNFHPNTYVYDNSVELSSHYLYVHKDDETYVYFNSPLEAGHEYSVKMIDYQKIYKFKVHQLNYFSKAVDVKIDEIHTEDGLADTLENISFTLNSKSMDDANEYDFTASIFNTPGYYSYGYWYDKDEPVSCQASFSFVREGWRFNVKSSTLFKKNDLVVRLPLLDETFSIDRSLKSTLTFQVDSPFIHYYRMGRGQLRLQDSRQSILVRRCP